MTYRITIHSIGSRFSYYGVFPDGVHALRNAAGVAPAGARISLQLIRK